MYFRESGTHGAPSIIFLHGSGTYGWMWEGQIAALSDYHCIAIDLPGHGKSNQEEWRSLADTADQVAEVIRSHATGGKAHVVGLSLGGYVTLHLLDRHPSLIDHAIISGVTSSPLPNAKSMLMQMKVMSYVIKSDLLIRMQGKMLHIPDDSLEAYTDGMRSMNRDAFLKIGDEVVYFQAPDSLAQVDVPTLVVSGTVELQPIKDSVAHLSRLLPNAQGRMVEGVAHAWNGQAPEVFNAMLRAWLTDQPLPSDLHTMVGERVAA